MKGEGLVSEGGVCSGPLQPRSGEKRAGGSVPPADGGFSPITLPSSHRVI